MNRNTGTSAAAKNVNGIHADCQGCAVGYLAQECHEGRQLSIACQRGQGNEGGRHAGRQDAGERPDGLHHAVRARQAFLGHQHGVGGIEGSAVETGEGGAERTDDDQPENIQLASDDERDGEQADTAVQNVHCDHGAFAIMPIYKCAGNGRQKYHRDGVGQVEGRKRPGQLRLLRRVGIEHGGQEDGDGETRQGRCR